MTHDFSVLEHYEVPLERGVVRLVEYTRYAREYYQQSSAER